MTRAHRDHRLAAVLCGATLALAGLGGAGVARGDEPAPAPPASRYWLSVAALAGSTQPDAKLADYQWRTTPSAGFGGQLVGGRGPVGLGLRVWNSETSQSVDVPGASVSSATVSEWTYEALLTARVWNAWGMDFEPSLSAGRLHMSYQPDQVSIPTGGPSPTMVQLGPVNEWQWGGGLALTRSFAGAWSAGLGLDGRFYSLDTAHRNGAVIETGRESFGDWSLRLLLARHIRIG